MKRGRARRRNHYRRTGHTWSKLWLLSALAAAAVIYGVVELRTGRGQEAGGNRVSLESSGGAPDAGAPVLSQDSGLRAYRKSGDETEEDVGAWTIVVRDVKDSEPVEIPVEWQKNPQDGRIREILEEKAEELAGKWDRAPVDSQMESLDKDTGTYQYSREVYGRALNKEQLVNDLMYAIKQNSRQADIQAVFRPVPPSRTQAQAKEQYKVIGTFTTTTTSNKNRNQNIRLAADAIDGMVLKPGEEFSFNMATGNRTSEKGYQPAGAYRNGVLIEEPGGGVCQVSTTLYHAIINSGYKTTERNFHSFAPSYIEKGQDAMVSFDGYAGPDLRFVNTGNASIGLRASFADNRLKLSIVGLPVLEAGMGVSLRSEKVKDLEPPAPVYEENPELGYGEEKVTEQAQPGSVWRTYRLLTKADGTVEETLLHTSTYKAKAARIQRNTAALPSQTQEDMGQETDGQDAPVQDWADEGTDGEQSGLVNDGREQEQGQRDVIQAPPKQGIPSLTIDGRDAAGQDAADR